jgi:hypothetical protein
MASIARRKRGAAKCQASFARALGLARILLATAMHGRASARRWSRARHDLPPGRKYCRNLEKAFANEITVANAPAPSECTARRQP